MPLIKGRSKKAFEHNIEAEMHSGKPQKQALAIAYSVKRKAKKMAEGGEISARDEKRPMPENEYNDEHEVSENSRKSPPRHGDRVLEDISYEAHNKPKVQPLKHPKLVPQSVYTARLRDEEDDLQALAKPASPEEQPRREYDEEGPNRQGPKVLDMEDEHSTHKKPYAKGGEVEPSDYHPKNRYMHPDRLSNEEEHLMASASPSMDEGSEEAMEHEEMSPDRQGPEVPDEEDQHNSGKPPYKHESIARKHLKRMYAAGGHVQFDEAEEGEDLEHADEDHNPAVRREIYPDEMDDQPEDEEENEHESSLAAAVMSKMRQRREDGMSGSSDEDEAMHYATGGEILEHGDEADIHSKHSIDSDDSSQVDLSRNADEDANEEDQLSYNALRKENYSESEGLRKLDQPEDSNEHGDEEESDSENMHDRSLVDKIRSKMRRGSPMSKAGKGL